VKIDRSFVARLEEEKSATLVEGIISLGHRLDKRVVAEGVETEDQLARLREMGCDDAQGYLLCRPISAEAVGRMLSMRGTSASDSGRLH
jgi:EAL domain-containing protein (putative c-di-GMP-specific phosphodiesterase class I)